MVLRSDVGLMTDTINVVKALYNDFECAVVDGEDTTKWFKIKTGVKQSCNMSGLLFLLVVDWLMRHTLQEGNTGIRWKFPTTSPYYHRPSNTFSPRSINLPMKQKGWD